MSKSSTFVAADADGYEPQMGRWSRLLAEPFLDFVGSAPGESVLDVGCGTGSLADALKRRCNFRLLLGVDFSPVYIAHAARQNRDARVSFEVGDACALGQPDGRFDRVMVLHFVPRAKQAIAEMRRVAKPGATVAAAVWDARGGFVANRISRRRAAPGISQKCKMVEVSPYVPRAGCLAPLPAGRSGRNSKKLFLLVTPRATKATMIEAAA